MGSLKATWMNGQVVLKGHADWPEGRRLIIQEDVLSEIDFMTEDEQSDNPEAIQAWIDELRAMPPVPESMVAVANEVNWDERMRKFNIEAVRQHFEKGTP